MKLVYVAGPYRAPTEYQILNNIENARSLGVWVRKCGACAYVPHSNSAFLGGALPDEFFLAEGLEILSRCDAMVLIEGWETSAGTRAEIAEAERLGIPVFEDVFVMKEWLENGRA